MKHARMHGRCTKVTCMKLDPLGSTDMDPIHLLLHFCNEPDMDMQKYLHVVSWITWIRQDRMAMAAGCTYEVGMQV